MASVIGQRSAGSACGPRRLGQRYNDAGQLTWRRLVGAGELAQALVGRLWLAAEVCGDGMAQWRPLARSSSPGGPAVAVPGGGPLPIRFGRG